MKLLVHIVTHRRKKLLEACVSSVLQALPIDARVQIILNGSDAESLTYIKGINDTRVHWQEVSRESLSASRNRGFLDRQANIIYYLDDDVVVPPHLFREVLQVFSENPNVAIVGGPNLTPPGSPFPERLFGATMTSFFCAPGVRYRYLAESSPRKTTSDSFIFCNLAVRRDLVPSDLRFNPELSSNQENLFLYEALARDLNVVYRPSLFVFHRRRRTAFLFFQQILSYGKGRGEQTWAFPKSLRFLFVIPSMTLLAVFFSPVILPNLLGIYLLVGLVAGIFSSAEIRKLKWGFLLIPFTTLLVHVAYGLGFLQSILGMALNLGGSTRSSLHLDSVRR